MALKMKVWTLLDIALRVPPLFLMDKALKYEFRPVEEQLRKEDGIETLPSSYVNNSTDNMFVYPWITKNILEDFGFALLELLLYIQVLLIAVFVFLFNTKQLLSIYIRVASVGIIILAYEINIEFLNPDSKIDSSLKHALFVTETYLIQAILALLFSFTNSVQIRPQGAIILLFIAPSLSHTFALPGQIQNLAPILTVIGCTILLTYSMWIHGLRVCETVYRGITWCHSVVENYGLYTMIETHWINLHIPQVFRAFWIIRMGDYLLEILNKDLQLNLLEIHRRLIIDGSENVIALLGMASVISILTQLFGYSIQKFLQVSDPSERNIGNVSAILFLLLSLQTGITNLNPEERYNRISRNLCLLYAALLHFILNILEPILMSLSASRNPCLNKHIRALTIASLLVITPAVILLYQWQNAESTSWLLALTSFMLELIIKATMLITIYALFMIDTYKEGLWENLDDYVYYLKGASSLTEFLLGIYLLFNGMWIFIFESSSAIRACMMCLHAYFNIWIQGHKGWETFLYRRSAQQKINFLQEATKEQLKKNNDVCAICFQDLKSARVTKCNHFFHGVCLRKWLNVQDICPLCHTTLYSNSEDRETEWIRS